MNTARDGRGDQVDDREVFSELLEDSAEDLYENAPCGYLSTLLDGQIAKVNTTLLAWLGYELDAIGGGVEDDTAVLAIHALSSPDNSR